MSTPRRRRWWQAAAMVVAGGLTVALTQNTTTAAFTGQTSDTANSVGTANSFCVSSGNTTLTATADTAVYQAAPNSNYGSATGIGIGTGPGADAYSFVKFTLPALPANCDITGATLKIYASTPTAGGTLYAYRAAAAWNAATMTWNTGRPTFTGTPASTASLGSAGTQQWDVTTQTQLLYSGTDYGFLLKDSVDGAASARYQTWASIEVATSTQRPQLTLSWG